MLKISKTELECLVKEEVVKQDKKLAILKKIEDVKQRLDEVVGAAPSQNGQQGVATAVSDEEQESIFDARPGETVVFNFQDVTIKLQRQLDDLFKVVDAMESKKLKEGDYIKIQGNDTLQKGKKFKFIILREALKYESNPLVSWKVIKNR